MPPDNPAGDLLAGVRVLDLTNVLAGPFAGYQLGLMGADVVKIEVPGSGDLARNLGGDPELSARGLGISFLAQNGGKRSLTLDLKSPAGREVFERLVRGADVLLENFRPGVLERLGFGWGVLRALNEGLVYCAVSGFGQTGPMRERPAYDQIIQGLSGMMSVTGSPESAPTRTGFPIADTLGGYAAAFAISAALVKRSRTGTGSYLDVSMLETAVAAMGWVVSDYLVAGREPRAMGNENATSAPSGTFATADGALNIAANKQEQYVELCTVLGRPELVTDDRFATREARKLHRVELKAELERTLGERSAAEWDDLLSTTGVPVAPVLTVPQALALDQLTERHLLHQVPMPGSEPTGPTLENGGVSASSTSGRDGMPPGLTSGIGGVPTGPASENGGVPAGLTARDDRASTGSAVGTDRAPVGAASGSGGVSAGSLLGSAGVPPGPTSGIGGVPTGPASESGGVSADPTAGNDRASTGSALGTDRAPASPASGSDGVPAGPASGNGGVPVGSAPGVGGEPAGSLSENGGERSLRVLGSSVHVDGQSVGPTRRPPQLGEHVDEILVELGYTADEIADLRAQGVV